MRQYLTMSSKRNEIRMLLKHPSYTDKAIVIVEGGSDIRLFRSLLNSERFKIESAEGKIELADIIDNLKADYKSRLAGLRDADHDRIVGNGDEVDNIILTDLHDAEMMMLSSSSLDNFINEYASNENHDDILERLRESVFDAAYIIGIARLVNEIKGLKLNFKAINISGFVSVNKLSIDIDLDGFVSQLISRSPNADPDLTKEVLINYIEAEEVKKHCRLQVCSGHDVTKLLERVFSQSWVSIDRKLNQSKIESALRLGYTTEMFAQTGVYESLKNIFDGIPEILAPNKCIKTDAA
ncbi:DUF4435 domain-containing protein [Shewanella algae]|uniref:DUF4435 domain-containing protein n=1 Tax=Shewanella algae TaxID=38313 RepID=UPI00313D5A4E